VNGEEIHRRIDDALRRAEGALRDRGDLLRTWSVPAPAAGCIGCEGRAVGGGR
jgi:hypothetical protein